MGFFAKTEKREAMPMMTKQKKDGKIRAVFYCRVSTSDQNAQMQLDELHRAAEQRGWIITGKYVDTISGSKEGPERHRMMQDAQRGLFDTVMVWRFDRFGRSAKDLLLALDHLSNLGIAFVSIKEALDTNTIAGRMVLTMLGAVAEMEKSIIKERITAGLDRAKRNGKRLGRPERTVDVERAMTLLAEGRSQRSVAMALRVPRSTLRRAIKRAKASGPKSPTKNDI